MCVYVRGCVRVCVSLTYWFSGRHRFVTADGGIGVKGSRRLTRALGTGGAAHDWTILGLELKGD